MQETWVWSLGWEDPLEKGTTTHSSILAWRIPWTEEPGGLQFMWLQRVRHNWMTFTFHFTDSLIVVHRLTFSITCEILGFLGGLDSKGSTWNAGDVGSVPGRGRSPGEGNNYPLQFSFLSGEFHGPRSLAGYSPWGCKELDTTERLSLHFILLQIGKKHKYW